MIPKTSVALRTLLKADLTTQWRNRRAVILVLLVPVIILISWKAYVDKLGGAFVLSNSLGLGLIAVGLMGYSNSIARDRDKGIFQRLRVTPLPSWAIMTSRLLVQMILIIIITTVVLIAGHSYDEITLTPAGYILTYLTTIICGAVYLSLGQVIVGLIKNPETVNSTSRLVYFVFIMVGTLGSFIKVDKITQIIQWSPYGTVRTLLSAGMVPGLWTTNASYALLATLGYTMIFATIGIQKFKWDSK